MLEYDLLKKNELKFSNIDLKGANLNDIAKTVARIMQLDPAEVLVTDVLDGVMTLDILRDTIYPHQVLAKKDQMLDLLGKIPGVTVTADTMVTSEGMLGWIAADEEQASQAIAAAETMTASIKERLAKRAMIFSTGAEVMKGEIEDTNCASITQYLNDAGYRVKFGGTLSDDQDLIAGRIRRAVADGYTTIFTTGGVGAESKDCTVEAILDVDTNAATPYICTFTKGVGRHVKEGVRIAVGEHEDALIIALPGPNDEVRTSMPIVMGALQQGRSKRPSKQQFAESIAANLRGKLREKMQHHAHHHNHAH